MRSSKSAIARRPSDALQRCFNCTDLRAGKGHANRQAGCRKQRCATLLSSISLLHRSETPPSRPHRRRQKQSSLAHRGKRRPVPAEVVTDTACFPRRRLSCSPSRGHEPSIRGNHCPPRILVQRHPCPFRHRIPPWSRRLQTSQAAANLWLRTPQRTRRNPKQADLAFDHRPTMRFGNSLVT